MVTAARRRRSDEVVVLSNDIVPGMGLPVAAPGIRAWGIARGLRAHGHPVRLAVAEGVVRRTWSGTVPPPTPPSTLVCDPADLARQLRRSPPRALVLTNSNHASHFLELRDTRLVYDFFAPKLLEKSYQAVGRGREAELAQLREGKLRALARCDAIVVNGAKKLPYVMAWSLAAGRDVRDLPVRVVNMPVPPVTHEGSRTGPVRAVVTGYLQAWSRPGAWVDAMRPLLDRGLIELDLLVAEHWGTGSSRALPAEYDNLLVHDAVHAHGTMLFGDFQDFLSTRDLSIDVFARNRERELAMVTRTVVALASGLPVLHVPFTECGPIIAEHDAGWLVDPEDTAAIADVLDTVTTDRGRLHAAREGARKVAAQVFEPAAATAPLHDVLEELA